MYMIKIRLATWKKLEPMYTFELVSKFTKLFQCALNSYRQQREKIIKKKIFEHDLFFFYHFNIKTIPVQTVMWDNCYNKIQLQNYCIKCAINAQSFKQ